MPTEAITIGPPFTLLVNTVYATPPRACVYFKSGAGTVEVSNDGTNFAAVTPDANGNFTTSAPYMRSTGNSSIVTARV